jgi:protein TonB
MILLLLAMIAVTPVRRPALTLPPFQQLSKTLQSYRSGTVSRIRLAGPAVVVRSRDATFAQSRTVVSSAAVEARWVERAVAVLLDEARYDPKGECSTECWPCDSAAHLEVAIELGTGPDATDIVVLFRPRCAEVLSESGSLGSLKLGAGAGYLFDLIKRALPADSVLQAMKFPPRDPKAIEKPPAVVSTQERSAADSIPKFGEYVYVEVLPEVVNKVPPAYPQLAREANVDGTVLVQALVGRDGRVKDVMVVKSIGMLDTAAVTAVRQWVFKPAMSKGSPVAVWVACPVKFSLH